MKHISLSKAEIFVLAAMLSIKCMSMVGDKICVGKETYREAINEV